MLGYPHNLLPLEEIVDQSVRLIKSVGKDKCVFACANPHSLVEASRRPDFEKALKTSSYLVTDGAGLALAGKLFGQNVGPRITGSDYFEQLMKRLNVSGEAELGRRARVFFFGSSPNVLSLISSRFEKEYPNIDLCGTYSPPFGEFSLEENEKMLDCINSAKPDVLWVGMTAPKQELWVYNYNHRLDVRIVGSIGAVFDFFAGTYPRAPNWAIRYGLEWLVRLYREPRRMWRRNFISTPKFFWLVLRWSFLEK